MNRLFFVIEGTPTRNRLLSDRNEPSRPLMPTAMGSDPSLSAISHETAQRRMSFDMSGPMCGIPVDTTKNAQVANASHPAEERINKTPIFISTTPGLLWRGCQHHAPVN
jgi:hypothetical protein